LVPYVAGVHHLFAIKKRSLLNNHVSSESAIASSQKLKSALRHQTVMLRELDGAFIIGGRCRKMPCFRVGKARYVHHPVLTDDDAVFPELMAQPAPIWSSYLSIIFALYHASVANL